MRTISRPDPERSEGEGQRTFRFLRALFPLATLLLSGLTLRAQSTAPRAAHQLARGISLVASDIVSGTCTATCAEPGWVTRKVIAAGELLVAPAVSAPFIIVAGDSVDVEHRVGGVTLSARGVAMSSVARYEQLLITLTTGARVTVIAVSPTRVRLP